jgi:hypothetical protein
MDRREIFGMLGVGALGLSALSGREVLADEPSAKLDAVHKECLEACAECDKACDMASNHCLDQVAKGNRDHAKPLRYMTDCAGFCALAACNIARHSPLMVYSCEACASACKETLAVVSRSDLPEMKAAAEALERCEKSCRAMVEAMGHRNHAPASTAPRAN